MNTQSAMPEWSRVAFAVPARASEEAGMEAARGALRPVAIVVVSVPPQGAEALSPFLTSLEQSRGAGDLRVVPGALAVLLLSPDAEVLPIVESVAPGYPFPVKLERGAGGATHAVRRAMCWADSLGVAGAPVLLASAEQRVAPRWAYGLLAMLRDGVDLVARRPSLWQRLTGRLSPVALSARAQSLVDRLPVQGGSNAGWPRRRVMAAGLRVATA